MWNSKIRMTEREYLKYNNPNAFDKLGKPVKPGDTVVINNHYGAAPYVGVVDHFTQSGSLAICYDWVAYCSEGKSHTMKGWAYRDSSLVVKIKNGSKGNFKNKE